MPPAEQASSWISSTHMLRTLNTLLNLFVGIPSIAVGYCDPVHQSSYKWSWFGEHNSIPIDNLTKMLFCLKTTFFQLGSDIYQQEEGLAVVSLLLPVTVKHIHGIFWRNGFRNSITKANSMVTLSFCGLTRKLSNTAGPCELL